jgi:aryl-alcohol dehydrogenase-like predicted oxidoreductase
MPPDHRGWGAHLREECRMQTRRLGSTGPALSAIGLGCMGMSDFYGPTDRAESLATIDAALDAGITQLDTGDFYGTGHNELLVGQAIAGRRREDLFIAVKFGAMRSPDGGFIGIDCRPAAVKNFLAYSLRRLGTEYVDLYQPARLDPTVPIEDTIGAIKEMIEAGFVRYVGLSEAGADTLRRAHAAHPVAWLQIEYSLVSRGIEAEILPTARELGVGISAYGVLSRGLISGHWTRDRGKAMPDYRAHLPRFTGDNLERNLELVEALRDIADRDRLGTRARRAPTRPAGRGVGCARSRVIRDRPCANWAGGPRRRRRGRPLRRPGHDAAGQRAEPDGHGLSQRRSSAASRLAGLTVAARARAQSCSKSRVSRVTPPLPRSGFISVLGAPGEPIETQFLAGRLIWIKATRGAPCSGMGVAVEGRRRMPIKDLLVLVDRTAPSRQRLEFALAVAPSILGPRDSPGTGAGAFPADTCGGVHPT